MYKLCALSKTKGWVNIEIPNDLEEIYKVIEEEITAKDYYSYILKERKDGTDYLIKSEQLFEEVEVEYSDDVKVNFEVKTTTFKPSKMKQKQEFRKEIEKYL